MAGLTLVQRELPPDESWLGSLIRLTPLVVAHPARPTGDDDDIAEPTWRREHVECRSERDVRDWCTAAGGRLGDQRPNDPDRLALCRGDEPIDG